MTGEKTVLPCGTIAEKVSYVQLSAQAAYF